MGGATVTFALDGIGSINANSAVTDAAGTAAPLTFTSPPAPAMGTALITATFGDYSDIIELVVRPPVEVTITPTRVTLTPGATRQFSATVLNATDTSVTWSATGGSINSSGLYTAGTTTGTFRRRGNERRGPNEVGVGRR